MLRNVRGLALAGLLLTLSLLLAACNANAAPTAPAAPSAAATPLAPIAGVTVPALGATPAPIGGTPAAAAAQAPTAVQELVVQWEHNAALGDILTDPQGLTLYTTKNDKPADSTCSGECANAWPPLLIGKDIQPVAGPGVPGKLATIARSDATYQVTYDGMPLYRYSGDSKVGETNGQGLQNVWAVVTITPTGPAAPLPTPGASLPAPGAPLPTPGAPLPTTTP